MHCRTPLHSSPALAGRPLQTEDAGVLEPGACEIEGATHRLSAAGERSTESHLQWGCGIGWTSQIAVAASKARDQGVRSSGLAIGGKTGLWKAEGQDDGAALTLAASSPVAGRRW